MGQLTVVVDCPMPTRHAHVLAIMSFHQATPIAMRFAPLGDLRGASVVAFRVRAIHGLCQELLVHTSNNEGTKSFADWT